jgi:hypothetical protein
MHQDVFLDPLNPYKEGKGNWTLQIGSPLPDIVPIGHYELNRPEPVVRETISRSEYLDRIQQSCARYGAEYLVRFYDHADSEFDASILDQLSEIRTLKIDVNCEITNPEAVGRLPNLEQLGLAPRGKTLSDILKVMGVARLTSFTLGETSTPPIDLLPLAEAKSLRTLRLLAQGKNIEAIGECPSLLELSLHPPKNVSLDWINRLQQIEVLKFSLGSLQSMEAVGPLPNLKDLSFNEVRMLEALGDLQRFPALRRLQTSYQSRLKELYVGPGNAALEHITVDGIDCIHGFTKLPAVKSLWSFNGRFAPDWSELPATLTHFALVTPSLKKREKHFDEVRARGLNPERHPDASFFYK